ncbi:hypothetical protein TKK_0000322 [Trichogramma kaykai]
MSDTAVPPIKKNEYQNQLNRNSLNHEEPLLELPYKNINSEKIQECIQSTTILLKSRESSGEAASQQITETSKEITSVTPLDILNVNPVHLNEKSAIKKTEIDSMDEEADFFGFPGQDINSKHFIKFIKKLDATEKLGHETKLNLEKPIKRTPFCKFCKQFVVQFPRHLKTNHADKQEVKIWLKANKNIQNTLLSHIRNKGYSLYYELTGNLIPVRGNKTSDKTDKVDCKFCGRWYSKKSLWKHKKYHCL